VAAARVQLVRSLCWLGVDNWLEGHASWKRKYRVQVVLYRINYGLKLIRMWLIMRVTCGASSSFITLISAGFYAEPLHSSKITITTGAPGKEHTLDNG